MESRQVSMRDIPSRSGAKERLLESASALLCGRDTLDFSLLEVAGHAQLNHGLVKYYFGGKEGLLLALLERDASMALDRLRGLVALDIPPLRKIELHIRGVINVYYRFPYINRLINMLQCSNADNSRELSRIFIMPLRNYQAQMLKEARALGEIREIDAGFFYYTVIGACDFLFHSRNTLPFVSNVEQIDIGLKDAYADHVVRLLLDGIRTETR